MIYLVKLGDIWINACQIVAVEPAATDRKTRVYTTGREAYFLCDRDYDDVIDQLIDAEEELKNPLESDETSG